MVDLGSIGGIVASYIACLKELGGHVYNFIGGKCLLEEVNHPFFGRKPTGVNNNPLVVMRSTPIDVKQSHPILRVLRQMIRNQGPNPRRNTGEMNLLKITLHLVFQAGLEDPEPRTE